MRRAVQPQLPEPLEMPDRAPQLLPCVAAEHRIKLAVARREAIQVDPVAWHFGLSFGGDRAAQRHRRAGTASVRGRKIRPHRARGLRRTIGSGHPSRPGDSASGQAAHYARSSGRNPASPVSFRKRARERIRPRRRRTNLAPSRASATVSPRSEPRSRSGRLPSGKALRNVPIQRHEMKNDGAATALEAAPLGFKSGQRRQCLATKFRSRRPNSGFKPDPGTGLCGRAA